jgi:hypothetical protein
MSSTPGKRRIARERKTLRAMLEIYCHSHHETRVGLCGSCEDLRVYAMERLSQCPFQPRKPICSDCTAHCYNAAMRQCVREVMRYAGPRMIWRHPALAMLHVLDGHRFRREK